MTNIKLTAQEATLLKYLMNGSAFNSDQIDLTKSWEEQKLENGDAYYDIVDLDAYNKAMSIKEGANAVLSHLKELGVIDLFDDDAPDGSPMTWLIIEKENFDLIKTIDLNVQEAPKAKKAEPKKHTAPKAKKTSHFIDFTLQDGMTAEEAIKNLTKSHCKNRLMKYARRYGMYWESDADQFRNWQNAVEAIKDRMNGIQRDVETPKIDKGTKPALDIRFAQGADVNLELEKLSFYYSEGRIMSIAKQLGITFKEDSNAWENAKKAIKEWVANDYFPVIMNG